MKAKKDPSDVRVTVNTMNAAMAGDKNAIAEILSAYDPYIREMSVIKGRNDKGEEIFTLDEDLMQHLRLSLIDAIPKFKPVSK